MKQSELKSSDIPSQYTGSSQETALADLVLARIDNTMAHDASAPLVERARERWPCTGPIVVGVLGVVAISIVVSAINVVSRVPFGETGVVLPTRPPTTTTAPPTPPISAAPIPPPVTRAPSAAPPAIAPSTVAPSVPPPPPPPKPSTARPSSSAPAPSNGHPTTHKAFPQETTDFPGPPGTNN
jgi:hypothetical protein